MTRQHTDHGTAPNRTSRAVDVHDIRALTDTGAIRLPDRAAPTTGDREPAESRRPGTD